MIPVLTPDGVGTHGPSGKYKIMGIGDHEVCLVLLPEDAGGWGTPKKEPKPDEHEHQVPGR